MILNSAENGKHTGMILIDLLKAFDTLDHEILLDKTKCIDYSDKTIKFSNTHTYLYADDTSIFCQHKDVAEIKNVLINNLQMYAIDLLIINYQFMLVKIKQNAFFPIGIRTYLGLTQHTIKIE